MFISKLQSIIRQVVSLFILTSLLSAPSTMVWAISPPPHNTTNPYQWFSMEDVLQKAELSGLTDNEIDQLGFAEFCQRYQIAGSFAERKAQLKAKIINLQHELNTHPSLKQPATGAIAPFLSEADYNAFPEIEVTTTADTGPGSLRDAVAKAETMNGSRIIFRLRPNIGNYNSETGIWTIEMKTKLIIKAKGALKNKFPVLTIKAGSRGNGL